jgi:hypothetical protein
MLRRLKRTLSVLMLLPLVLVVGCGSMVEVKIVTKAATPAPTNTPRLPTPTPWPIASTPAPTATLYPTYPPYPTPTLPPMDTPTVIAEPATVQPPIASPEPTDTPVPNVSTPLGGIISTNTTWTTAGSPYVVEENILVSEGVALTIEPGVEVKLDAGAGLQVKGGLVAQGTAQSPITFTSNLTRSAAGDWAAIEFLPQSMDASFDGSGNYVSGSILEYVVIRYGGGSGKTASVMATNAAVFINQVTIENSANSGFALIGQSGKETIPLTKITNSTITNNSGYGIYADAYRLNGSLTVDNSTISGNGRGGISTGGGDGGGNHVFVFTNNTVSDNGGDGIQGHANGTQTILSNTVTSNTGTGIRTRGNGTYILADNVMSGNTGRGILAIYTTHVISGNIISANGGGIEISQGGNYTIRGNTIVSNIAGDGSAFQSESAWSPAVTLEHNLITGNTCTNSPTCSTIVIFNPEQGDSAFVLNRNNIYENTAAYEIYTHRSSYLSDVDASYNWWGTTNETAVWTKIYDWTDGDSDVGIVDYAPYLTSPDTDSPVSPPSGLVATPDTTSISLAWAANAESDVTGYKVYWDSDAGFPYTNSVDVGNVTAYILSGLSAGTTYYIATTAYDGSGNESWYSRQAMITPGEALTTSYKNKIVFKSDREGGEALYVMNPDGSDQRRLDDESVYYNALALENISPDSKWRLEVREIDGNVDIWRIDAAGPPPDYQITSNAAIDQEPVWAPIDQNRIAFVSTRMGSTDIWTQNVSGDLGRQLTDYKQYDKHPSWSPDGTQIVYWSGPEGGPRQIWVMNAADGRNKRNISNNDYNDWDPIWIKRP